MMKCSVECSYFLLIKLYNTSHTESCKDIKQLFTPLNILGNYHWGNFICVTHYFSFCFDHKIFQSIDLKYCQFVKLKWYNLIDKDELDKRKGRKSYCLLFNDIYCLVIKRTSVILYFVTKHFLACFIIFFFSINVSVWNNKIINQYQ